MLGGDAHQQSLSQRGAGGSSGAALLNNDSFKENLNNIDLPQVRRGTDY